MEDHGIDLRVLALNELAQARETGHDVSSYEKRVADDPGGVLDELIALPVASGWPYVEPTSWEALAATLPAVPVTPVALDSTYRDRVHGAWAGRIAGNMLGKPVEDGDFWTVPLLRRYLELASAYPLTDYVPVLVDPPEEFAFVSSWTETVRGQVDGSSRDDDVDYTVLALHLLEVHGRALTPEDVGDAWLERLPFRQTYTAERAAYRNLVRGLPVPETATWRNPYREWIGAQIRADAFGYVLPGDPLGAARLAYADASLSHVANGVYGELWAAALVSLAFCTSSVRSLVEDSLAVVPPQSRLASAVRDVLAMSARGLSWDAAIASIWERYGHYHWVHTLNNAAVLTAGLLWGEGDFTRTIALTVQGGLDTDSNGATAGSVAGILNGLSGIPPHWIDPLHDRVRSALFGFDNVRISDLADRTIRLAASFRG